MAWWDASGFDDFVVRWPLRREEETEELAVARGPTGATVVWPLGARDPAQAEKRLREFRRLYLDRVSVETAWSMWEHQVRLLVEERKASPYVPTWLVRMDETLEGRRPGEYPPNWPGPGQGVNTRQFHTYDTILQWTDKGLVRTVTYLRRARHGPRHLVWERSRFHSSPQTRARVWPPSSAIEAHLIGQIKSALIWRGGALFPETPGRKNLAIRRREIGRLCIDAIRDIVAGR